MADPITDDLNGILAEEWALVRLLRKLETKVEHEGATEALKRIRFDTVAHCATLSRLVRDRGAGPVDKPSMLARQTEATEHEVELWTLMETCMDDLVSRIQLVAQKLDVVGQKDALGSIEHTHRENRQWLQRIATPKRDG